jgi:CRP-like cAMP-binding protein
MVDVLELLPDIPDADASPDGDEEKNAGWFLRTLGPTGREGASHHIKNWRQGALKEDDVKTHEPFKTHARSRHHDYGTGDSDGGVLGQHQYHVTAAAKFRTLKAQVDAVRQAFATDVSPEKRRDEIISLFKVLKNDFLTRYPDSVQRELARHMKLETFQDQDVIFAQGTTGNKLYVVVTGGVRMTKRRTVAPTGLNEVRERWVRAALASKTTTQRAPRVSVTSGAAPADGTAGVGAVRVSVEADLTEGDSFGLLALYMGDVERSATATAVETNTSVLTIDKGVFTVGRRRWHTRCRGTIQLPYTFRMRRQYAQVEISG